MLSRKVVIQIIAFVVIGVVAVVYAAMRYAGIGSSVANPGYTVKMDLANGGGIFTNAEVTYRGVAVGKVTGMRLVSDGLELDLHVDSSAPPIPSNLKAAVADRSAVGEQYVDLVPSTGAGPYLHDGSVITKDRTSTPLPTQSLLTNLDALAKSVPTDSLRTVVNELNNGFSGTGPDLQNLLDTVSSFTRTAQQQLPQTTALLDAGRTVLDTQNHESSAIRSFSSSLEQVAAQLKSSDPNLRRLIQTAPQAATQITNLLTESGPDLGSLLANLTTTANILVTRQAGLQLVFVAYPQLAAASGSVVPGDGTAHLGLALNVFDPPVCTQGYQGTKRRPANDTTQATPNTQAYCASPPATGIDVRGASNAPYGGNPGKPANGTGGATGGGTAPTGGAASAGSPLMTGSALAPMTLAQLLGVG